MEHETFERQARWIAARLGLSLARARLLAGLAFTVEAPR